MIYVYLSLLILSFLGLVYLLYSLEINRKLNIKKRQFAIRPSRNKFFVIFCINVLLFVAFGFLFVNKIISSRESPIVDGGETEKTGKPVSKTTPLTILSNDLELQEYENGKNDRQAYYYYDNNQIYRYDLKEKTLSSMESNSDKFELLRNNIIVYYETNDEGKLHTHLDFYDKETFKIEREIIIDGHLVISLGLSGFFSGSTMNVVVESFDLKNIDKFGYQEVTYKYEKDNDEEVLKEEKEKVYITEMLTPQHHNYDRVIMHLQYNFFSDSIKTKAIYLSDYYLTTVDGYFYIFSNAYGKSNYANESLILKYNPNDLSISDYHSYANLIYSSPIVEHDGITTYLTFMMYNQNYSNYQIVKIDHKLDIIDMQETYLDTSARVPGKREKNLVVFDNKIIKLNNVIYYDNSKLINYEVLKEEHKIVVNEYLLTERIINKYYLATADAFDNAKILDITLVDGNYFIIYEVDDKEGYLYFPKYVKEEDSEEEKNDDVVINEINVELTELTSDKYYIVNNNLVIITINEEDEKEITTKKISQIFKDDLESGE